VTPRLHSPSHVGRPPVRLPQLADFGFSKDPKQQSEAKTRVGTPAYLAPEVIAAQPGRSYDAQVRLLAGSVCVPLSRTACCISACQAGWAESVEAAQRRVDPLCAHL